LETLKLPGTVIQPANAQQNFFGNFEVQLFRNVGQFGKSELEKKIG